MSLLYLKYAAQKDFKFSCCKNPWYRYLFSSIAPRNIYSQGSLFDNGLGKQRRLINVSEIAREKGPNYCTTLLGIYIYTGEDATSASKGKGKIGPLKRIHLSFILFSKVSEKNGQLLMRFAAKFRHLQVLCLDIQGKENKYSTRKDAEKNGWRE